MIEFNIIDNLDFILPFKTQKLTHWLKDLIEGYDKKSGDLNYIFCSDNYLLKINIDYLNHNTYTDIITFDYSEEGKIEGDIFISIERVNENASTFQVPFTNELLRVMAHGVLHLIGFKDKNESDRNIMRSEEEKAIQLFEKFFK